jgi:hypothetical protein
VSVDIKALKARGISSGAYRKIFTADEGTRPQRVNKLIELITQRAQAGRDQRLLDYRTYWAIDLAYEEPLNQTKATLIRNFLQQEWETPEKALEGLSRWGLIESDLFIDAKIDGVDVKVVNPPVLFKTIVPIVQAYTKARLSKIFNERNGSPLLPYNPLKQTTLNEVVCEIVTDLVQTISTLYGYPNVLHDAIQQMLKYGVALAFPREEWHYEEQLHLVDGKEKKFTVKEGLRYVFPHPTRMFWDMMYPLHTINTDTGCEFAGYWNVIRYGDILENREYWNRAAITYGESNWFNQPLAKNYFQEVFPCQLQFPSLDVGNKREDRAAYYSKADEDKAVFTAEMYMKIVPSRWGLGLYEDAKLKKLKASYDYPVWHKFTLAGDNTIIWAEPCAYTPPLFMGYDYDPNAARNSSLSLECISAQDQVSNLMTQMLISSKQNLTNVIFYDNQQINKTDIEKMSYKGDARIMGPMFIGFDSLKVGRAGTQPDKAFQTVALQKQDINQLLQMVSTTLNLLERTLQISAQETGGSASHQQSKEEVQQTGGASTNRLMYTSSFVDEFIDAWKRQLYEGYQAYGDAEISAQVSADIDNLDAMLTQIGFSKTMEGAEKSMVKGSKDKLRLEGFARANEGPQMQEDKERAQVIFQTLGTIAAQPELFKAIGIKNFLQTLEWAARLGGAPRGFRLRLGPQTKDDSISEAIQQAIVQAQQATLQAVEEKIAKPVAQEMASDKQRLDQIDQVLQQLQGIYKMASQNQDKLALKKAETDQKLSQREEAFRAEEKRKDVETHAEIAREFEKLRAELQAMFAKEKAQITVDAKVADAKIGMEKEAAAKTAP